jgi:hypothetical protein
MKATRIVKYSRGSSSARQPRRASRSARLESVGAGQRAVPLRPRRMSLNCHYRGVS